MTRFDIYDTIARLRAEGLPFCIATVTRTADVTSAKAGAKAAITGTGEILGHLGGACVQTAVKKAAAEALACGTPRLIRVKPKEAVVTPLDADGVALYRSGCPSGGTVELMIEVHRLPPRLAVLGGSLVAQELAGLGAAMGYRVLAQDAATGFDLSGLEPEDFVVIATQGRQDLDALRAGLTSPARFCGMVASRRKAATLVARLRAEGMAEAPLSRLRSPVGLDLGGIGPEEIALSVLAEVVQVRRRSLGAAPDALGREHG